MANRTLPCLAAPLLVIVGCNPNVMMRPSEPVQKGASNPLDRAGAEDLSQRQQDCWDMPNAHACYEVGLAHELGLNGPADASKAKEYYDKACELGGDPEHCEAARRMER